MKVQENGKSENTTSSDSIVSEALYSRGNWYKTISVGYVVQRKEGSLVRLIQYVVFQEGIDLLGRP